MSDFQLIFLGYLIGALSALFCMWLTAGDENAPDDAATSEPEQTQLDKDSIAREARKCKR